MHIQTNYNHITIIQYMPVFFYEFPTVSNMLVTNI